MQAQSPAPNTKESVDLLIAAAHDHYRTARYAEAETSFEHALRQQEVLDKSARACFDILCDLAHVANLRGRNAREAALLRRIIADLFIEVGEQERHRQLTASRYTLMTASAS